MVLIKWDRRAVADLDVIDFSIAKRIVAKVSWLGEHCANIIPELLHYGVKGMYKLRVGDYRVLYKTEDEAIIVKMVDHRSRIYKRKL